MGAAQALVVGTALLTIKDLQTRVFGLLLISLGTVMGAILYSHVRPGREPLAAALVEVAISLIMGATWVPPTQLLNCEMGCIGGTLALEFATAPAPRAWWPGCP